MRQSEKQVQRHITNALRDLGCFVVSFSQPQRAMMTPGIPDLFVARKSWRIAMWIEVKAEHRRRQANGGLSADQLLWHAQAKAEGLDVITAYSVSDVVAALRQRGAEIY